MFNKKEHNKIWMRGFRRKRNLQRKEYLLKNGPCKRCGSTENLELDHIDPKSKSFMTSHIFLRSKKIRDNELKKCQILCQECHKAKTLEDRGLKILTRDKVHYVWFCVSWGISRNEIAKQLQRAKGSISDIIGFRSYSKYSKELFFE